MFGVQLRGLIGLGRKDVGMPPDEFMRQIGDNVFNVERLLLGFDVGMKQNLEQKIPKLFAQVSGILRVESFEYFIRFFQ